MNIFLPDFSGEKGSLCRTFCIVDLFTGDNNLSHEEAPPDVKRPPLASYVKNVLLFFIGNSIKIHYNLQYIQFIFNFREVIQQITIIRSSAKMTESTKYMYLLWKRSVRTREYFSRVRHRLGNIDRCTGVTLLKLPEELRFLLPLRHLKHLCVEQRYLVVCGLLHKVTVRAALDPFTVPSRSRLMWCDMISSKLIYQSSGAMSFNFSDRFFCYFYVFLVYCIKENTLTLTNTPNPKKWDWTPKNISNPLLTVAEVDHKGMPRLPESATCQRHYKSREPYYMKLHSEGRIPTKNLPAHHPTPR